MGDQLTCKNLRGQAAGEISMSCSGFVKSQVGMILYVLHAHYIHKAKPRYYILYIAGDSRFLWECAHTLHFGEKSMGQDLFVISEITLTELLLIRKGKHLV